MTWQSSPATLAGNDLPQPMNLLITHRLLPPWSRPRRNSPGALAPCIKARPSAGSIGSGILHQFSIGATGSSKSNTTLRKILSFHIRPGASVKLLAFCSPPATSIHKIRECCVGFNTPQGGSPALGLGTSIFPLHQTLSCLPCLYTLSGTMNIF
ncbi:hypothetical protein EDB19DRAFT_502485 [Suillus lakei]|nr:hypothetical protein EDB19DRAFT_502485 [Suillus lakei]